MDDTDRPVAAAILAGASIVDEIVAVTGLPLGAVLGALTRLEGDGFVVGRHGRYAVSDVYAGAALRSPRRRSRPGPVAATAAAETAA